MALSGNKLLAVGSYWYLLVEWTATQNVANNQSTVTARVYWQAKQGVGAVSSNASKDVSITIDGTKSSSTATAGLSAGQSKLLHTYVKTVTHGSDGLKNLAISATFDMAVNLSGTYYSSKTVSGSWALNSIARASSFTITDKDIWAGEGATVNITKASPSFTHTVYYKFGVNTRTIATKTTAVSVPFLTQMDDLNAIPNSDFGNGDIYVDTYDGATLIGSNKITFAIHVPNSVAPTINTFAVSDSNSTISALMGVGNYVQGFSKLQFSIGATGKYGSTIASYTTSFNGYTSKSTSWNHGIISKAGNLTATLTVIDSRGLTTTQDLIITVIPYSAPTISSFTAIRNATVNTTINLNYSVGISPLMVGVTAKNSVTVQLQYKPRTGATWTTKGTYTGSTLTTTQTGISASISYDFRIVVSDKLSSNIISTSSISTASVLVDLAQLGVGFGKMWEKGAIDVKGSSYFDGAVEVTGNAKTSSLNVTGSTTLGSVNASSLDVTGNITAGGKLTAGEVNATYIKSTHNLDVVSDLDTGGNMYVGGILTTSTRTWLVPTLLNNVSNLGQGYENVGYYKDAQGFIHLRGFLQGASNGKTLFMLPVGYRPTSQRVFSTFSNHTYNSARVDVYPDGKVNATTTGAWVLLDGIMFNS